MWDKASNIAKNPKYDGFHCGLSSMVYKFFHKRNSGSSIKNEHISNKRPLDLATLELAAELHKPIIKKFNKRKVQSPFTDNIWRADLADIQLINKFNEESRFLLCVIDICSKYAWVIPLKDKKGLQLVMLFRKF